MAHVGRPCFAMAAQALSAASGNNATSARDQIVPLRASCLSILQILAASGCMLLEEHQVMLNVASTRPWSTCHAFNQAPESMPHNHGPLALNVYC